MREDLVGLKVKINRVEKGGEYRDIVGLIGVVERNGSTYGIRILGKENSSSQYGYFWLNRDEFVITDEEYEEPKKCEMIDDYYIVGVKGSYSKRYSYKCRFDVNIGDKVVCEDEDCIQTVIEIYNIETSPIKNPTKEVVCVIDYSVINARKEREKLIAQIKRDLDAKVKQIQSKIDYDFYASKDSEVARLLNTLNELKGDK